MPFYLSAVGRWNPWTCAFIYRYLCVVCVRVCLRQCKHLLQSTHKFFVCNKYRQVIANNLRLPSHDPLWYMYYASFHVLLFGFNATEAITMPNQLHRSILGGSQTEPSKECIVFGISSYYCVIITNCLGNFYNCSDIVKLTAGRMENKLSTRIPFKRVFSFAGCCAIVP